MIPQKPILDVMKRTIFNFEFIKKQASSEGPYEITQLINSFLGAMAHPWEQYKNELNNISLTEADKQGWPKINKELSSDKDPKHLGDLLRLIRNGIAHGNIKYFPDEDNEINVLQIWNINHKSKKRDWGTLLTVDLMEIFLYKFVNLAESLHNRRIPQGKQDINFVDVSE